MESLTKPMENESLQWNTLQKSMQNQTFQWKRLQNRWTTKLVNGKPYERMESGQRGGFWCAPNKNAMRNQSETRKWPKRRCCLWARKGVFIVPWTRIRLNPMGIKCLQWKTKQKQSKTNVFNGKKLTNKYKYNTKMENLTTTKQN